LNLRPSVLETDALPTELLPYALLLQQVYPRFCSAPMRGPPSVSRSQSHALTRTVRITLRGVTALGTPTATGPIPPHKTLRAASLRRTRPTRLAPGWTFAWPPPLPAAPVVSYTTSFIPHPLGRGLFAVAVVVTARAFALRVPVLAVSHGNHVCGSREVPLVEHACESTSGGTLTVSAALF
jgi:hypothetical protein